MANWTVGARRDLPIDADSSWVGDEAKASIFEWAGFDGDNPDPDKARRGFLVYDAAEPKLKGSYKLPFSLVKAGTLTALASGLRAAASRLPQTDDLPDAVRTEARAVLDGYFERLHADDGRATSEYAEAGVTYSRVLAVRAQPQGSPDTLLTLARSRAVDPTIFDDYPPFFWSAEASNNNWDAYDTRMSPSTLKNYADDAAAGVAFLRNHNTLQDPTGHSLRGVYTGPGGNGIARTTMDFYALSDPDTAPYIAKVRAGVVRDVSVGFYGGQWVCSICGRDMMAWFGPEACPHLLGVSYTPRDEAGSQKGEPQVARATIENAHLAEVSGVYDGATPGAMISKARMLSTEGLLEPRRRELVEARYRIHLPDSTRRWAGMTLPPGGEKETRMSENPTPETPPAQPTPSPVASSTPPPVPTPTPPTARATPDALASLRQVLVSAGQADAETGDVEAVVRGLLGEVARLRPLADDGRAYRKDLIEAACREGVRALGEGFAQETYRGLLENAPLDAIKRMRDDWSAAGDKLFGAGRQTQDQETPPRETTRREWAVPSTVHSG